MSSLARSLTVRLLVGMTCVAVLSVLSAMVVEFPDASGPHSAADLGPATVTAQR